MLREKPTVERAQELDVHMVDDDTNYWTQLQHKTETRPLEPPRQPSAGSLPRPAPFQLNPQGKRAARHQAAAGML